MKSNFFCGILLVLAMSTLTQAQIFRKGPCPNYTTPEDYNIDDFRGRWYELAQTPRLLEPFTRCVYFEYSGLLGGKILINTIQRSPLTGLYIRTQASVTPTQDGAWKSITGYDYRIFATDNKRFAVVHACQDGLLGSTEIIWLLTRDKFPDYAAAFEAQFNVYFDMKRYSLKGFQITDQENCPEKDDALFG